MPSALRRLISLLLALALLASACGPEQAPSDAAEPAEAPTATAVETPTPPPTTEPEPVPDDDPAAEAAIDALDANDSTDDETPADPGTTFQRFLQLRFNIDPTPEQIACVVDESASNSALDAALRSNDVALGNVDDAQLRALSESMNGCLDTLSLADWATLAIGPRGEVQQTAPPCISERFDDPANGDLTFYSFVALLNQFRIDPAGGDLLVELLATCTPVTALSDFFAGQAEQTSGFETLIDRECLVEVLTPPDASTGFWSTFVQGGTPPADFIQPYLDQCPDESDADYLDAVPVDFVPFSGTGTLSDVRPSQRNGVYFEPPPMMLTEGATYDAVLATGGGDVTIRLFADTAPITVNSFVALARDGYYDGTVFHRVLDGFMAQAGDPSGTGAGGPGYQFEDETEGGPPLDSAGLLAMANSGPNTNGSQFFITFAPTDWLTGNHTVFGEVTSGMEIVEAIQLRDPSAPTGRGQVLESVTIIES